MTEGLRAPQQTVADDRIVFPPVIVAITLAERQARDERSIFFARDKAA
jgi:hypothetical protein